MARRLSETEKKEIVRFFTDGKTIEELSIEFNCTKLTISRNLKISIGEKKYKEFFTNNKRSIKAIDQNKREMVLKNESNSINLKENVDEDYFPSNSFLEITPLNCEFDNTTQKDLSSVPISEIQFPNIVYMIVDKKIELDIKYLRDYPDWQFLAKDELNRKTIEIFVDLKNAKKFCNKEQKVIKVPNTEVFKISAPLLLNKGISRIIFADQLIAL